LIFSSASMSIRSLDRFAARFIASTEIDVEGAAHAAVQLDRQSADQHVVNLCVGQRLEQFGNLHGTDERMLQAPS
jgi:hypothetical protein